NVADLLTQLREGQDVLRGKLHPIDTTTRLSNYYVPEQRATFEVLQSTAHGWNAVHGEGWTSIIRTRFVDEGSRLFDLYSQICDADAAWCDRHLAFYIERMQANPPPDPPPAPPGEADSP